jgi:hypothetical protein
MAHHPVYAYIYASTLLRSHFTTQQANSELWSQQDPEFNTNFPVLDKRDFKSMRDVRKYAPNQTVTRSRCAHGEFCVM